jgi:hypothetical protein
LSARSTSAGCCRAAVRTVVVGIVAGAVAGTMYIVVPIFDAPSNNPDGLAGGQLRTPSLVRGLPSFIERTCAISLFAGIGRAVLGLRL